MISVTILAMHNAGATTITGPMDIFHSTGILWNHAHGIPQTPKFDVKVVTVDGEPVRCLNRMLILPHCAMGEVKKTDLVLVSSILDIQKVLRYEHGAIQWLADLYASGTALATACTGAYVLAETGLLDGKTATTHWGYLEEFRQRYPGIDLKPERMITDEGDLYTSGASNACLDLSIYLVEKYCGHEAAVQCAKGMLIDPGRSFQSAYASILEFQKKHNDEIVTNIQDWIESHFSSDLDINLLADRFNLSRRTLERRFKNATGDTPLVYLQRVRIEAAKTSLETTPKSFDEISYEVGYSDCSFFRKLFKKHTHLTPKEYRHRFRRT